MSMGSSNYLIKGYGKMTRCLRISGGIKFFGAGWSHHQDFKLCINVTQAWIMVEFRKSCSSAHKTSWTF
jgi:hypothetical protein